MLSEILPRDRDWAFKPLTAVNIAPRMLIGGLALGNLRQVSDGFSKRRAKSGEARFTKGYQKIDARAGGWAAECARSWFGKNCIRRASRVRLHVAQSLRVDSAFSQGRKNAAART